MKKFWPRGLGRHLSRHPQDVGAIVSSAWSMRRNEWWRRSPYLPVPDDAYWAFRMTTAYGAPDAVPTAEDVVAAARWAQRQRRRR